MSSLVVDDDDDNNNNNYDTSNNNQNIDSIEVPLLATNYKRVKKNYINIEINSNNITNSDNIDHSDTENHPNDENKVDDDIIFTPSSFTSVLFPVLITMTLSAISVGILADQQDSIAIGEGLKETYIQPTVGEGKGSDGTFTFGQNVQFALLFIGLITVMTFVIVLVLYCKCYRVMFGYLLFAYSLTLGFTGGLFVNALVADVFGIPIDSVSLVFIMYNFAVGGCLSIFWKSDLLIKPILKIFTDFYLVAISILMAYIFSQFSQIGGEVIIWCILVALAFYDLCAVLSPCGPLKLLLKVVSNDKDGKAGDQLSGLLYEAGDGNDTDINLINEEAQERKQEVAYKKSNLEELRNNNRNDDDDLIYTNNSNTTGEDDLDPLTSSNLLLNDELSLLNLINDKNNSKVQRSTQKSRPIRLGLGDFIFYSVLVSTAGHFGGAVAAIVCMLTIQVGLGTTLMLLVVAKKALPALPIPILFCVIIYSLFRFSTLSYVSDIMSHGYVL